MAKNNVELKTLFIEDFGKLHHLKGNRPKDAKMIKRLRRELEANLNVLTRRDWIIIVNKKGDIIDGQNHYEAILEYNRRHKLHPITAIQYVEEDVEGLDAITRAKELNSGMNKWKDDHYIGSYKELGYEHYAVLDEIVHSEHASGMARGDIYLICGNFDNKHVRKDLYNGTLEVLRETKEIYQLMDYLKSVKKSLSDFYGPTKITVPMFLRCTQIPDINVDQFIKRLNHPLKDTRYSIFEKDILESFDIAYNHNRKKAYERINIIDMYKVVDSYNTLQEHNSKKMPNKKKNVPRKVVDAYNTIVDYRSKTITESPEDDLTPPTQPGSVMIRVKDTGKVDVIKSLEDEEANETKRRAERAAMRKVGEAKRTAKKTKKAENHIDHTSPIPLNPDLGDDGVTPV